MLPPNEYGCEQPKKEDAENLIFSDEAQFDLVGYEKKQNCCIWGTEKPHAYIEKPMDPKRGTVW